MEPLEDDDPQRVGRFELLARLGSGGMGRVYLARTANGERFALKMIHLFLSDDTQFRRRFQREVMAARRVSGNNTAALVDADPDGRPPWMAVEYVDGPTLTELIEQSGPLTLASIVRLATGMAQALIDIHRVGLVHRDLKPSNVLMGADGARLIDFGIAQASGASVLTTVGSVTGSAGFMSPEQAQAEHVTEASDVFALGTVLFFAATGRRPFGDGSMIAVTYRVVHAEPDLSEIRDDGLRDLISHCLMKDPQQRPTPRELLERLPGLLDGTWVAHRRDDTSTVTVPAPIPMPPPPPMPDQDGATVVQSLTRNTGPQTRVGARAAATAAAGGRIAAPVGLAERIGVTGRSGPRTWIAVAVGVAVLAGATTTALMLSSEPSGTPRTSVGITDEPLDPGDDGNDESPSDSDGGPTIIEVTTRGALPVPTRRVTGTATPRPTVTTARPTATATRPVVPSPSEEDTETTPPEETGTPAPSDSTDPEPSASEDEPADPADE